MSYPVYNTLFLCTANSARSIMAEAILNRAGGGRFRAFSAGSLPRGSVNPVALALLQRLGYPTLELRSKSWDEFAQSSSVAMDFVFTVCDRAAGESCPAWPGQPMTAHWGIADPDDAGAGADDIATVQRFRTAFSELERRIDLFISLPLGSLDALRLQHELDDIGRLDALPPGPDGDR